MSLESPHPLAGLVAAVEDDVRAEIGRIHDRALNEERALLAAAEDHVAGLERAATELGEIRGRAAEEAIRQEAEQEVEGVVGAAFDRLAERFLLKVRTALEGLPQTARYPAALAAWAREAARAMTGPCDVVTAPRDRQAVYEALLGAGAQDFSVLGDDRIRAGLVARDLEGRTLLDLTPAALVPSRAADLTEVLRRHAPPPPGKGVKST